MKELKLAILPYPPGYDDNAHCEYHMDAQGHTMEDCNALKHRVQDLINYKAFIFTCPNVATNPMPVHAWLFVKAIEKVVEGRCEVIIILV